MAHRRKKFGLLATCLLLTLLLVDSLRANWPQWRGPDSNGSTQTARNLPVSWSQTENVLWRAKLPSWSAATPIIWGDVIFVTSAEEGFVSLAGGNKRGADPAGHDKIFLMALNRKDGSVRWQHQIDGWQSTVSEAELGIAFAHHGWQIRLDHDRQRQASVPDHGR